MTIKNNLFLFSLIILIISSCSYQKSKTTGWNYNDRKHGGFDVKEYTEQTTPSGMVFVEGGRLSMGRVEEDVMHEWNNIGKTVTVSSFYIDATEVRNIDYVEYLQWLKRHYVYDGFYFVGKYKTDWEENLKIYEKALPDTLVWRDKLGENETFIKNYLRHPAYREYPVVGISWEQAHDYCKWRTDRTNERILIDAGLLNPPNHENRQNQPPFTTDAYLKGGDAYLLDRFVSAKQKSRIKNKRKVRGEEDDEGRYVTMDDGLLIPDFRLPTEAEWEHAASGLIGHNIGGNHEDRKIYPWSGSKNPKKQKYNPANGVSSGGLRNSTRKHQGAMMANFKKGRGDNMGIAGSLDDGADATAPVISYWPNDYGLYNMAGNVSEWVADVYRPVTEQTSTTDHRPFRGNVYKDYKLNESYNKVKPKKISLKDDQTNPKKSNSKYIIDPKTGRIETVNVNDNDTKWRRNYKQANNVNYLDGDIESQMIEEGKTNSIDNVEERNDADKKFISLDKRNKDKEMSISAQARENEIKQEIISLIDTSWSDLKANIETEIQTRNNLKEIYDNLSEDTTENEEVTSRIEKAQENLQNATESLLENKSYQKLEQKRKNLDDIYQLSKLNKNNLSNPTKENQTRLRDLQSEIMTMNINNMYDPSKSSIDENDIFESNSNEMYEYGLTTLISDRTRVYKGGSWKDRAYWLNPATRRFLDQSQSTDDIGFRCAMDRLGSSTSNMKSNQTKGTDYRK